MQRSWLVLGTLAACLNAAVSAAPLKALIVDGQNNHAWKETTPVLKKILEDSGLFTVDVATAPPKGADMSSFSPNFAAYRVVVLNYNGDAWPAATEQALENYVSQGGGLVSYHAADNAFTAWKAFQRMIGIGGWGGRKTPDSGSKVRWTEGQAKLDASPGNCGHHGARQPFQITVRAPNHPIVKGLPAVWMHAADELYDSLCGPAERLTVLATAHSDPANSGTGENEPMLMTVSYGKGRVFHTALGHDVAAMQCTGFIVTLLRGTEWAATGKVTQKLSADFPSATETRVRK